MAKPIYYVAGSKGGVGKSMVATALIDYLVLAGEKLLLVEADTANPDVGWTYEKEKGLVYEAINLDDTDGWMALLEKIEEHKDKIVVVNTPARNNMGGARSGEILAASLADLDRTLEVLWVINRQRDSIELLQEFMEYMGGARIHVVRNLHHGTEVQFAAYNGSDLRKTIETEWRGTVVNFPMLAGRVADSLNMKRMSIAKGVASLPIGNRAELQRWRREAGKVFTSLVDNG